MAGQAQTGLRLRMLYDSLISFTDLKSHFKLACMSYAFLECTFTKSRL